MVSILYDGWPLIYHPNSSAALHLLALLAQKPASILTAVALPAEKPPWLPEHVVYQVYPVSNTPSGRLAWEQRELPRLREKYKADLLHHISTTAPLLGLPRSVISPTGMVEPERSNQGLLERLRQSLGQGGTARARAIFWPADLPDPTIPSIAQLVRLPPIVFSGFPGLESDKSEVESEIAALDLPETYILYHGTESHADLNRLMKAWSWAAGSIGEYYPLVMIGMSESAIHYLKTLAWELNIEDTLRFLPVSPPTVLPKIYKRASAVFHPASVHIWGGAIRQGLASGLPIVSVESLWADAMVGPAGILRPVEDTRALGAALITVIVEEGLAEELSKAARKKNSDWNSSEFSAHLEQIYPNLLGETT